MKLGSESTQNDRTRNTGNLRINSPIPDQRDWTITVWKGPKKKNTTHVSTQKYRIRTSYASETSWNFLAAEGSLLFVSGWYFLASW